VSPSRSGVRLGPISVSTVGTMYQVRQDGLLPLSERVAREEPIMLVMTVCPHLASTSRTPPRRDGSGQSA